MDSGIGGGSGSDGGSAAPGTDMPRPRVLMLSKALVVGAYQRKAELVAAAAPEIDLTVVVPRLWRDDGVERRLERAHTAGYHLVETSIFRPGDFHLHLYPRLGGILDGLRPDLVHVDEEPYNLAAWLAVRGARRRGARTVFFTWQNLKRRYPPPFRWFERDVYRRVDGAIAGSRTAADVLAAKGYRGPAWVIPQFGVDPEQYRPPDERPARGPLRVGYAGRLVAGKGVDVAIRAVARMARVEGASGDVGARLAIVGGGPERPRLEALAESLGIAERTTFTPWLPSAAMPAFYRDLDVLVLPSRSTPGWIEQFGRVLVEAMACGAVVVGSDSGEIPHVVGDAGIVVPEGDAEALAGALRRLAGDAELRRRLAERGRARVLARFTMARVAAETVEVYRAVLAGAGRGHPRHRETASAATKQAVAAKTIAAPDATPR